LPEGHGGGHGPDEALHIESWLLGFRIYVRSILRLDALDFG
jgi:succinyl-diaminopimelate desuccinylase